MHKQANYEKSCLLVITLLEIVLNINCRSCTGHVNGSWQLFTKCPEASAYLERGESGQIKVLQ